jgi:hypothetical protein
MTLPDRWTKLRPHPEQIRLINHRSRFRVVPAGRRSGKTERAKRFVIRQALSATHADARYFLAAPTRDQAKAIFWSDLKQLVSKGWLLDRPVETDLVVKLVNGAEIQVVGMDKPERIEGRPWDGGVLDEYANMKPGAWGENVRPALSDRRGWCWLIGVPEGRNHYYDMYKYAQSCADQSEWAAFSWPSSDILPPDEIESARRDLDDLTFDQEYNTSFVNFSGRAYYVFDERKHCAPLKYDPKAPIAFCFDFNVEPGVACVAQEQLLPSGHHGTGWIGEVWIPRNSNTPAVCKKLKKDWGNHQGRIVCYGDATGGARGSAKVSGSDWDLIKAEFGDQISIDIPNANPQERSRINAVNTRFLSSSGIVRMMVDPVKCPHLVKDFEGVTTLEGGSGELDKKRSPELSHISDGAGYYVARRWPVQRQRPTLSEIAF